MQTQSTNVHVSRLPSCARRPSRSLPISRNRRIQIESRLVSAAAAAAADRVPAQLKPTQHHLVIMIIILQTGTIALVSMCRVFVWLMEVS